MANSTDVYIMTCKFARMRSAYAQRKYKKRPDIQSAFVLRGQFDWQKIICLAVNLWPDGSSLRKGLVRYCTMHIVCTEKSYLSKSNSGMRKCTKAIWGSHSLWFAAYPFPIRLIYKWVHVRYTATKIHLCIPRKGIVRRQSQFPHSCFCVRVIYSQVQSTYFLEADRIGRLIVGVYKSLTDTWNLEIGTEAAQFLFWEFLFSNFRCCVFEVYK
jgi:hypothetical protein